MLLGILLMILTLYGLLLFWIVNEKLKETGVLIREVGRKLEEVEKKLSLLLESGDEGGENTSREAVEEHFSFRLLQREKKEEKGE
ncbi:MAG: hypothetical protein HPY68_09540 [Candidatus Atribacteria bacterium]|nr:hypothetical protein [Candidatus Atribacteria bacterium]